MKGASDRPRVGRWAVLHQARTLRGRGCAQLRLPGGVCQLAPLYDTASWLPYTDVAAHDVHLAMTLGASYQLGAGTRIDDRRDTAQALGADPDWAAAEVMRIARETPARLIAEIDTLPAAMRASESQGESNRRSEGVLVTGVAEKARLPHSRE